MTLTEQNQNYIYETYQIVRDIGVDIFHVQFSIFTSEEVLKTSSAQYEKSFGQEAPETWGGFVRDVSAMDPDVIKKQMEAIRADIRKNKHDIVFRQTPAFEFSIEDYYRHPEKFVYFGKCLAPWRYLQIMPNGDVAWCIDFVNMVFGNIRKDKLEDIWNNEKARAFRRSLNNEGLFQICGRCDTYMEALNPCLATWALIFNRKGRLDKYTKSLKDQARFARR
jgi:radical SAM protein with 4Fe4S-binding SPASM domain